MACATLSPPNRAEAASVRAEVRDREVTCGQLNVLSVTVEGSEDVTAPQLPALPDFVVSAAGTPNTQRSVNIINGRVTRSLTVTYAYRLRSLKVGRLEIPPVSITVDGRTHKTRPITITSRPSHNKGIFEVEFLGHRDSVYIEQPLDLTLRILVRRPENEPEGRFANQIWRMLRSRSDFGLFDKAVEAGEFDLKPGVKRKDAQGKSHSFIVLEGTLRIRPEKPGTLTHDPLFLEIPARSGPSFVEIVEVPDIVVKPIPQEGRPPTYNRAVGRYDFRVWVDRTEVRRGQLITLNMEITGEGLLERVSAPPLAKVPELTEHFKVLDEQLAGEIKDGKKIFRQKIRAIDENCKAIPAIPFTFFDPEADGGAGEFVTVQSEPIPITVVATEMVTPEEIIAPVANGQIQTAVLTEAADSIRANYDEADAVLANQAFSPGAGWAAAMVMPPLVWFVGWIAHRYSERLRTDVALARRRTARRNAERSLRAAVRTGEPTDAVSAALLGYIADRTNLPTGGLTRPDAVARLRADGVPDEDVEVVDEVLQTCEAARYAGLTTTGSELVERASDCVKRLEKVWKT